MAAKLTPTLGQLECLKYYIEDYPTGHGGTYAAWKDQLTSDWRKAGSQWRGPYHLLHQIRNVEHSWVLDLPDDNAAAVEQVGTLILQRKILDLLEADRIPESHVETIQRVQCRLQQLFFEHMEDTHEFGSIEFTITFCSIAQSLGIVLEEAVMDAVGSWGEDVDFTCAVDDIAERFVIDQTDSDGVLKTHLDSGWALDPETIARLVALAKDTIKEEQGDDEN